MNFLTKKTGIFSKRARVWAMAALAPAGALAQSTGGDAKNLSLDDILTLKVDVGSTQPKTVFNTPSTVSVISREMIERYGFSSLKEAVGHVVGVRMERQIFTNESPIIRGVRQTSYTNKILIMIDGVPQWEALNGSGWLSRVGIEEVERIEVLRGPATVLYGTNAFSGAINIVLRNPASDSNGVALSTTSRGAVGGDGFIFRKNGAWSYLVAANGQAANLHREPLTDNKGAQGVLEDTFAPSGFTARVDYNDAHRLMVNTYSILGSYMGAADGSYSTSSGPLTRARGFLANYKNTESLGAQLKSIFNVTHDLEKRDIWLKYDNTLATRWSSQRTQIKEQLLWDAFENVKFEVGGETEFRKVNYWNAYAMPQNTEIVASRFIKPGISTVASSVYGQVEATTGPVSVIGGVRYTGAAKYRADVSPRVTAVYSLSETQSVKLGYGESIRVPSFREWAIAPTATADLSNPNLKPEKSRAAELSYVQAFASHIFLQSLLHYGTVENGIYRSTTVVPGKRIYTNGNPTQFYGGELELSYKDPTTVETFLNYAYTKGNKGDQSADGYYSFKMVPHHLATLGVSKTLGAWTMSAVGHFVGSTVGPVSTIKASQTYDLGVTWQASKDLKHTLKLTNTFNYDERVPEFVIRGKIMNSAPMGNVREIVYTANYQF